MTLTDLGLALLDFVAANNRRDQDAADRCYAESQRLRGELEAAAGAYAREHGEELRKGQAAPSRRLPSEIDETMIERFWKEGPFR